MMDDKAFFDNAVYHKGCITKYLLSKAKSESLNIASSILDHDTAFRSLISDVHEDLFVGRKAFPMSQILQIYISHLPDHLPKTYPVTKLQDKLERYYDKAIIVQPQRGQGKSNFVFSSNVSIGNVVAAAGKLKSKLKTSEIEQEVSQVSDNISDDQILHSAAKILRRDIENLTVPTDDYPTPNEASLAVSMERMPSSLTKFVCWLMDNKSFKDASEPYVVPFDKIRKVMGITECIVSVSKDTFTPFHLGLAVQLHNDFG